MISPGVIGSVKLENEPSPCAHCGSTSQVGRGLCLQCLLYRGLGEETYDNDTLESVLDEVEVRDADWRLGNYQILEEIGRGGMGVIYRARQRHSRRIVALKRILAYHADSRDTLVRFRREAEAAASLDHPNILPIYEVGEGEDGLPFFSMKLATGGSLLESQIPLHKDPRRSVALMVKVSRAVQYAHAHGILHRDLKPGNILLDGHGEPMVTDFGLAKWLEANSDLTRTLTIFGTPGYIAPEQAHGPAANLKPTADIYSLGAILFDLLAGRPPFLGEHALSVIQQANDKTAPKLRSFKPTLDRDLETICSRCLEREPNARYHTAGDLAEDLGRWLEGRPIVARPVSSPVRVWRWSKRNPKLAGSLAAAVILGAIGIGTAFTSSRLSSIVRNAEIARHSVIMMPFEDLDELSTTSNSAQEIARVFTDALANSKGIQLRSTVRKSEENFDPCRSDDWKDIGASAGARFIISGSVRQRENRKRVVVRLLETATGSVISTWLQDVDSYSDAAKTAIAKVSGVLELPKTSANTQMNPSMMTDGNASTVGDTKNTLARDNYQRGNDLFVRQNKPELDTAIKLFENAVQGDRNYAQAYAMFATACQHQATREPNRGWLEKAEDAAAVALRIAPMLPEAYQAQAGNLEMRGRFRESIDWHLTAYELDPSNGRAAAMLGYIYDVVGRPDKGLLWFAKAVRREETARKKYEDNIADAWASLGDYEKAEEAFKKAAVFRSELPVGPLGLSALALYRGDYDSARKLCDEARTNYSDNPQPLMMGAAIEFFGRRFDSAEKLYNQLNSFDREGGVDFLGSVRFLSALGFIREHSGAKSEGRALLQQARALDEKELSSTPDNLRCWYSAAADYAALGSRDEAISALIKAIAAGWIDYRAMELDPRFDSIRGTQAFQKTLTDLRAKVEEMRRHLPSRQLASILNQ